MRKYWIVPTVAAAIIFFLGSATAPTSGKTTKLIKAENPIPGRYIVALVSPKANLPEADFTVEANAYELTGIYGGTVDKVFSHALKGYSIEMSARQAEDLSNDPRVLFVEEDGEVWPSTTAQSAPDWGLDRIDQNILPLNSSFVYNNNGTGVRAYIIDSGINPNHADFGGRASVGYDALSDGQNGIDCRGHGTHVAGIVGSSTWGVAKNVNLIGVRVLPCTGSGQFSDFVEGVDWVTANHIKPAVANVSINASGVSTSMTTSITNSIAAGVTYAVSAGNFNLDACGYSPANISTAIVAGATTASDNRAGYSNFGSCIDVWAPGHNITSTDYLSNTASRMMSGTSQASPMVAGVAALYLQNNRLATPATVKSVIESSAIPNRVTNIDTSSTSKMLYTWLGSEQPPQPGRVKIIKQVRTRNGGTASPTTFNYAATNLGPSSFGLVDIDAPPSDTFENSSVYIFESPGSISVTEANTPGWRISSIVCTEVPGPGLTNIQNTIVNLSARRADIIVEQGETVTCTFESDELAPTAAPVNISGRVANDFGSGLRGVTVSLTNPATGQTWYSLTNSFGYYGFPDVPSAVLYVVSVTPSKRYTFTPDSISFVPQDNVSDANFVGTPRE
jgi:subtilisin family serine protease